MIEVRFKRLMPQAVPPMRHSAYASGYDLTMIGWSYPSESTEVFDGKCELDPGDRILVHTGLALEIPPGFEGQVRSRSGLALHRGLMVLNSPGTIDSDYRGEVCVILAYVGHPEDQRVVVAPGDRVAQIVFVPIADAMLVEAPWLTLADRGVNGFGSTGVSVPKVIPNQDGLVVRYCGGVQ